MRFRAIRCAFAAIALAASVAPPLLSTALAGASLDAFSRAAEDASAHNRVALGYLRTGNGDLAQIELERLRDAWTALVDRFGGNRPDAFEAKLYTTTLTDISLKIATADLLLKSGRLEGAQASLAGIRDALFNLRRTSGVPNLADCILDSNETMRILGAFDQQPIDWEKNSGAIRSAATAYAQTLTRCDGMAPAAVKTSDEFRRLIDGAQASLALVSKADETKDGDLLHRIVIELRSFDNLLSFRFG
jgi:hypothetical protein